MISKEIKSRRGVYYDLEKSPWFVYIWTNKGYDVYKFSSEYKKKVFYNRLKKEYAKIEKFLNSLCVVGCNDINPIRSKIAKKVYNDMLYK